MKLFEHKRPPMRVALIAAALASVAMGVAGAAHAQEQTMEERLRAQLRVVTGQLQQTQNELAQLKAGGAVTAPGAAAKPAPPADAAELRAELAQSRSQLAREREVLHRRDLESSKAQQQSKEAVDKASAQVAQFRGAYDELLKMARASEGERQKLIQDMALQKTAVAQCEARNQQLYAVGMEVVDAYEKLDMSTVMSARQPFAAQSRVKFEQIAQEFGDRLYQGKFDARAVSAPAATDAGNTSQIAPRTAP